MKKILFAALVAALTIGLSTAPAVKAEAQNPYTHTLVNKSITAADTTAAWLAEDGVVKFEYIYTETSGTSSGKIYLEGLFLGSSWTKIDSATLTDVATAQKFTKDITATSYKYYRFICTNTGSATASVIGAALRRPNDR